MPKNKQYGNLDCLETSSENVTEDMVLEYVAQIIADMYVQGMEENSPENLEPEQQSLF